MKIHIPRPQMRQVFIFTLPILLLAFVLLYSAFGAQAQQFSDLAQSFLHGHLYFLHSIGGIGYDPIPYRGHQYWGEGLFPAVLLLPFAGIANLFNVFFQQGYIDWVLILATLYLVYALARKFTYSVEDSLILMFGWGLGSAYVGIAASSSGWSFAQVVSTFLLFLSLYEYFTQKRWWLIGGLCGCIFLTRGTAAPIVIFYALELWQGSAKKTQIMQYMPLLIPLVVALAIQGLYNYLRFHSPFNGGYEYQLLSADSAESRALGVFSVKHIPANLFSMLLGTPVTTPITATSWSLKFPFIRNNSYGMSLFLTSPYFLYLCGRQWKVFRSTARHLLVAAGMSCIGVLCFYGIGRDQFGYRYSLDFLPELFVVLMLVYRVEHRGLSRGMKVLLLGSGVVNWWLLLSYLF
jgi:hypothetical protein